MIHHEHIEWTDTWVAGADSESLPRVLLVGDSIARAYYPSVNEHLQSRMKVCRYTTSRSICDPNFLRELGLLLDEYTFQVIHFNNGLHGWDYTEATYARCYEATLSDLATRVPDTALLVALSTPMWERGETISQPHPKNARVIARNEHALRLAEQAKLPVSDLYTPIVDRTELWAVDGVHLKPKGSSVLGSLVADLITEHCPSSDCSSC